MVNYGSEEFITARKEMDRLLLGSLKMEKARSSMLFLKLSEITKQLSKGMIKWSRANSVWPMQFGVACCTLEVMASASPRIDAERRGYLLFRATPRQCDVMIVAGWITKSMVPEVKRIYEQMAKPRYVIAYGACATSGGPWSESFNIIKGIDQVLPVDIYVAGCPPRPENLFDALIKLQKKVGGEIEG